MLRTTTCCCCFAHVVLPLLNTRYVYDLSLLASCSHPLISISEDYAQNHLHVNSGRRAVLATWHICSGKVTARAIEREEYLCFSPSRVLCTKKIERRRRRRWQFCERMYQEP